MHRYSLISELLTGKNIIVICIGIMLGIMPIGMCINTTILYQFQFNRILRSENVCSQSNVDENQYTIIIHYT